MNQAVYYAQLEAGARYLASISSDLDERRTHIGWANRYYRLGVEARLDQQQAPEIKVA